jgi:hypothetical protein
MRKVRKHLTYANVMVTLLAFVVLAGGAAYAANTVFSRDIVDGEVKTADIGNNEVRSQDVRNDTLAGGGLTGVDIKNDSGVDTCPSPLTVQRGRICAGSNATARDWSAAVEHCAQLDLRLPSGSEAVTMAENYDVPGVAPDDFFWTDQQFYVDGFFRATAVAEDGTQNVLLESSSNETVCVTTPTN